MKKAFTLIEILIVVSIIALISVIAIPSFVGSRQATYDQMKTNNVYTVNAAKDQWSILYNKAPGTSVTFDNIKDYLGNGITTESKLTVDGDPITIGNIGTSAHY